LERIQANARRVGPQMRIRPPGQRRSISRSASRALDVLEIFGRLRRPLRAVEIARALDMCPSTTNQLLKTMVESAHLTFDAGAKSYLPSPRLAGFSAWMVASYGADPRIRDLMKALARASGETVTLATPNDIFMQILDRIGDNAMAESAERGLRVSIFGSTLGAAYLSTLADAEIDRLAYRARIAAGDVPGIRAGVERTRREGVADGVSPDERIWSLAAPLAMADLMAPLVLGLAGPADRVQARLPELRDLVRRHAAGAQDS
jgi:DNA-binding IclR family transcriptional regulator